MVRRVKPRFIAALIETLNITVVQKLNIIYSQIRVIYLLLIYDKKKMENFTITQIITVT